MAGLIHVLILILAILGLGFGDDQQWPVEEGPRVQSAPVVEPAPILPPVTLQGLLPPADLTPGPLMLEWFGDEAPRAARVVWCESRGQVDAQNPTSSAAGRFQVIRSTWGAARAGLADLGMHVDAFEVGRYDREQNTIVAWWLVEHGGGWQHWISSSECWR